MHISEKLKLHFSLPDWGWISRFRTPLMGFAILWIMFFHGIDMGLRFPNHPNLYFWLRHGYVGVEIFLFLSGIGMYYSLSKGYELISFYKKRLKRVLIPYLILSPILWIWQDLIVEKDVVLFFYDYSLLSFWLRGVRRIWFIAFILAAYLAAPFLYEILKEGQKYRLVNLIVLIGLYIALLTLLGKEFPAKYDKVEVALARLPIFMIGIYFGPIVKNEKRISVPDWLLIALLTIFSVYFILEGRTEDRLFGSLSTIPFVFIGILLSRISLCIPIWKQFILWCGESSLELYILHVVFRRYLIAYGYSHSLAGYGLVLCMSLLSAFLYQKIHGITETWLQKRKICKIPNL